MLALHILTGAVVVCMLFGTLAIRAKVY